MATHQVLHHFLASARSPEISLWYGTHIYTLHIIKLSEISLRKPRCLWKSMWKLHSIGNYSQLSCPRDFHRKYGHPPSVASLSGLCQISSDISMVWNPYIHLHIIKLIEISLRKPRCSWKSMWKLHSIGNYSQLSCPRDFQRKYGQPPSIASLSGLGQITSDICMLWNPFISSNYLKSPWGQLSIYGKVKETPFNWELLAA